MNINEFLKAISQALHPGKQEIFFGLLMLGLFWIFLIVIGALFKAIRNNTIRNIRIEKFYKLIKKNGLSLKEADLLEGIAQYLKDPTKKYLLMINRGTFESCMNQYKKQNFTPPDILEALYKKLNWETEIFISKLTSTRQLPVGMIVFLRFRKGNSSEKPLSCIVTGNNENIVEFRTEEQFSAPLPHQDVDVFAHNHQGIILFKSKLTSHEDKALRIKHSEQSISKGKFSLIKQAESINVYITKSGSGMHLQKVRLYQQIGHRMILENPERILRKGDDIRIYFKKERELAYPVNGEVYKTSILSSLIYVTTGHSL